MAAASQASLLLSFEGATVQLVSEQLELGRRGALRALAREAEDKFGVISGKYSFMSHDGKVDTVEKLERVLSDQADGKCSLAICEREDGRMMRLMTASMKKLEERLVQRMDESLAGVRGEVEYVTSQQNVLSTKLDAMADDALASRLDLVQEDDELRCRLSNLEQDCFAMREDTLASEKEIFERLDKAMQTLQCASADSCLDDACKSLEALDAELQEELDVLSMRELTSTLIDDRQELSAEVRALGSTLPGSSAPNNVEKVQASAPVAASTRSALEQDLVDCNKGEDQKSRASDSSPVSVAHAPADFLRDLLPLSSKPSFAIPYSSKVVAPPPAASQKYMRFDGAKRDLPFDFHSGVMAPFARHTMAPQLRNCQSSPVLPPLK